MTVAVFNVKVPPPERLEVRASGEKVATTWRTPGHDRELAIGLLFALGLIESARDVATVTHCGRVGDDSRRNTIDVRAAPGFAFDLDRAEPLDARGDAPSEPLLYRAALLDAHGAVVSRGQDAGMLNAIDKAVGSWLVQVALHALAARPVKLVVSRVVDSDAERRAARAGVAVAHGPLDLDR